MKRLFCTLVASMISVAVFGLFASASENDSADTDEITAASAITAYCEPGTYGVSVSSFSIPVNDVSKYLTITPDDFSIKNAAVTDALWSDELRMRTEPLCKMTRPGARPVLLSVMKHFS